MTYVPSEPGNPMTDPPKPRAEWDTPHDQMARGVDELCSGPEMVADNAEEVEHQLAMQRELRQSPETAHIGVDLAKGESKTAEAFQVGDVVRDIHSRQLRDVFAVDPGGSVQLIEGGCFWPREDYELVHRPVRMIPESDVREALQWLRDDRALVIDRVASMAMRVAATEVASRLGVELEQPNGD